MSATILKQVYAYDQKLTREWPVPSGTLEGTALVSASGQPAVTITPRGDATKSVTLGGVYTLGYPAGAVSQRSDSATVATDGSWSGPVVGATSATAKNTLVYIAADGTLTLTATSNSKFGVVDSYPGKASAANTTIKIGVFA